MSTISAVSSASSGIQQNLHQFNVAADRMSVSRFGPDLLRDVAQMKIAKFGVSANIAVLQTADEVLGEMVDIIA